jgi:hypothetical protein
MNFWLEALGIIVIPVASSVLFIGGYLFVANLWQRRAQRRHAAHAAGAALHVDNHPHN